MIKNGNMAIIHGRDLLVLNSSGTAIVAGSTSCDIGKTCDTIEVSGPSSGSDKEYVAGRKGWTVTVNYLVTTDVSSLGRVGDTVTLRVKVRNANTYLQGNAIISECRITATRGNLCQGSFVFTGSGALQ